MNIPDELIKKHEDGRVVFFCGAGISHESHLPDFKTLTDEVFNRIGELKTVGEEKQFKRERYDAVLGSLENRLAQPSLVRRKIREILTPDKTRTDNSVETHKALVKLATSRGANPTLKLVTTNFDLLFEPLLPTSGPCARRYVAPFLPTPRKGLWNGIVYLHGKLPESENDTELANLVLTSGDFGRAYLTEAWAARFVSELLRNYVVCFIGYSLGDQTVRYLMDAVEVYKRSGNTTEDVYMFVSETSSDDVICENKSVIQVKYDENACGGNHTMLHKTLQAWANSYSQGLDGKYEIIRQYASVDPTVVPDDGYVQKMVWALSEENDKTVKYFTSLSNVPNWNWVTCLEKKHVFDDNLLNSNDTRNRSEYFSRWILHYLTEPDCVIWAINHRSIICRCFTQNVEKSCNKHLIGGDDKCVPLDTFSERVWRTILAGKVNDGYGVHNERILEILQWLQNGDWDTLKFQMLGELFSPRLRIEKNHYFNVGTENPDKVGLWKKLAINLSLPWHNASSFAKELRRTLQNRLWKTVEILSRAFEDGLDLLFYIYGAYDAEDELRLWIPSIEDSDQNKPDLHNIITCVDMIREAWLEYLEQDHVAAKRIARQWLSSKHPTLNRFGLYAACVSDVIPGTEWVEFFSNWEGYMLWQPSIRHEMLRLFATKGTSLSCEELQALTRAIIKGPPACIRMAYMNDCEYEDRLDYGIFLRLGKLAQSGAALPMDAASALSTIKEKHPSFEISPDGRDEFAIWRETYDSEINTKVVDLPNETAQLVEWLKWDNNRHEFPADEYYAAFREACKHNRGLIIAALKSALSQGIWNRKRIILAVYTLTEPDAINDMAELVEEIVRTAPTEEWRHLANEIAFWCEKAVKTKKLREGYIAGLSQRFQNCSIDGGMRFCDGKDADYVEKAKNHPKGRFVSALTNECFPSMIKKGDGIREPYKTLFTSICTSNVEEDFYGRVVLASRTNALYLADEAWAQNHLLVFAKWGKPNEQEPIGFWQGFLSQNTIFLPALQSIEREFKETLDHYHSLSFFKHHYTAILMALALHHNSMFTPGELAGIMHKMDIQQLEDAAKCIEEQTTNSNGTDRSPSVFWRDSVLPLLSSSWPKSAQCLTDSIVKSLSIALLTANEELAKGLDNIWFVRPVERMDDVYFTFEHSNAMQTCTFGVLDLISHLVNKVPNGDDGYLLGRCLKAMKTNAPEIELDARYQRLSELSMNSNRYF